MYKPRLTDGLAVVTLSAVLGCAVETPISPTQRVVASEVSPWYTGGQVSAIETLTRSLADGLGDVGARSAVHAALRTSALSEHKLVLLDFLETPQGRHLLRSTAERSGRSEEELLSLARTLPPIDFYLPYWQQRRTWRALDALAVAALIDRVSPLYAYASDEPPIQIDRASTEPPGTAVLLLGPAEYKTVRPDADSRVNDASVIESTSLTWANEECITSCDTTPIIGGPGPSLRIDTLATHHVCDNGFCGEGNEFELRATDANGVNQSPVWRCTGIPSSATVYVPGYCPSILVHESAPSEVAFVDVHVVETDNWPNPDDNWVDYLTPPPGYVSYPPHVTDNASRRAAFLLYNYPNGLDCSPPNPSGNTDCNRVEVLFKW